MVSVEEDLIPKLKLCLCDWNRYVDGRLTYVESTKIEFILNKLNWNNQRFVSNLLSQFDFEASFLSSFPTQYFNSKLLFSTSCSNSNRRLKVTFKRIQVKKVVGNEASNYDLNKNSEKKFQIPLWIKSGKRSFDRDFNKKTDT